MVDVRWYCCRCYFVNNVASFAFIVWRESLPPSIQPIHMNNCCHVYERMYAHRCLSFVVCFVFQLIFLLQYFGLFSLLNKYNFFLLLSAFDRCCTDIVSFIIKVKHLCLFLFKPKVNLYRNRIQQNRFSFDWSITNISNSK